MTTGSMLYLLMTIAMFALFSVVLAYQSWLQSRVGPEMVPEPPERLEADRALVVDAAAGGQGPR